MPVHPLRSAWRDALAVYLQRPVITMLFLGFSAGLPFMLVFSTLTAWLTEAGVTRTAIGFFSWIGITYSIKILWAPVVDRLPLPGLTTRLGRRRGWMLAGQIGIATGLALMSGTDPTQALSTVALLGVLVAFSSASQDIAIDAFRIESAPPSVQGAMAATYQLGYRAAIIASYSGALYLAARTDWHTTYLVMAGLTGIGMLTTLLAVEPAHRARTTSVEEHVVETFSQRHPSLPRWFAHAVTHVAGAVLAPIGDFVRRFGPAAIGILALVATFRITDLAMASMANPLYLDLNFTKVEISAISGIFGTTVTAIGTVIGGIAVRRYGLLKPLLAGAILAAVTNLLFALLATTGHAPELFVAVIGAENLASGLAGTAFIAWMSSLTSEQYTATQYALFSSLMTLPGKFLSGFGGMVVDADGYVTFFLVTAALGLPAVLLTLWLMRRTPATRPDPLTNKES
ncbi:Protein AmpG [wastewater metagenome]|uniref:Protein AmpG n=2 Tax=unclassified sequences TaxID=12908 RepID=A0A5B8RBQ6_9ZZZZ|nr:MULTISPECIES: AmpG family muropeptide MFS transporter [Arhodomonas]QEA04802.1 protein AmpG [uncultured organism]